MDTATLVGIAFIVAGALVVLSELHLLTVYLLAIAAGLFAAGGMLLAGFSLTPALAVLALVVVLAMPLAHWARRRLRNRAAEEVSHDDVGHLARVVSAGEDGLRAAYRGSTWTARVEPSTAATALRVGDSRRILRRDGNVLVLSGSGPADSGPAAGSSV